MIKNPDRRKPRVESKAGVMRRHGEWVQEPTLFGYGCFVGRIAMRRMVKSRQYPKDGDEG